MSIPNAATSSRFVETATKWRAIADSSPPSPSSSQSRAVVAFVIVSRVVNVFEQTMNSVSRRIEVVGRLDEVGAVDVRDEAEGHVAPAVVTQRAVGHHRPEVRAADADVDDVLDRTPGCPLPLPGADGVGEGAHPVEHLVHLGDDVDTVDDERGAARHPQRNVEHGAVLGDVDPLAGEHRVAPLGDTGLLRERDEQPERLVGDAVLRVVEEEAGRLARQPLRPARIRGEEIAEVHVAHAHRRGLRAPATPTSCSERRRHRRHRLLLGLEEELPPRIPPVVGPGDDHAVAHPLDALPVAERIRSARVLVLDLDLARVAGQVRLDGA